MHISDQKKVNQAILNQKSAILFRRQGISTSDLVFDNARSYDNIRDTTYRTDMLMGSVVAHCISKEGVQAQRLAWLLFVVVRRFAAYLIKDSPIHEIGRNMQLTDESEPNSVIADAQPNIEIVNIVMPFWLQDSWLFQHKDRDLLREITLILSVDKNLNPSSNEEIIEQTIVATNKE